MSRFASVFLSAGLVVTAIPALALVGPAFAADEPGAFRCPAANTVLEFSTGSKMRAVAQNGFDCSYKNIVTGKDWTDHAFFFTVKPLPSEGVTSDILAKAETLWPLQAGKSVEVILNRAAQRYRYNYRVRPMERVTVEAGTFDAWPIEMEMSKIPNNQPLLYTYWWSPKVGGTIKYTVQIVRGQWDKIGTNYELLAIRAP